MATGPDGRVYVTWWDYSNANAIRGDVCDPASQNCASAAGWGTPQTIALLDSTGAKPLPFACPIVAQPGGRASTSPQVDVDHSGGAENGRVYVTWSDLRTGSGITRCDGDTTPTTLQLSFDSFVASAPNGALPGSAAASPSVGTRLITDGEGGGQASSDDWFAWLAVDQTTGQAWADLYSTRDDGTRKKTNFYARSVTPSGGGHTLGALTKVSSAQSDYSGNPCCGFGNDYGDYTGLAATGGVAYPVWTDNSTGDGEAYTFVSQVLGPPSAPVATTGDPSGVGQTSATVDGTVDPNGQATDWWVAYGPTSSYVSQTGPHAAGSARNVAPVTDQLTSLDPGTTYHYAVVAQNGSGTSTGADRTFTTTGPPQAPAATTLAASNLTPTSAVLHATVDPNNAPTTYHFDYGTSSGALDQHSADQGPLSGSDPLPVSASLSGLSPNTTYFFQVAATNGSGAATGVSELSFTTPAPAPSATTNAATGIGSGGATLNATINPHGFVTSYQFRLGGSPTSLGTSIPSSPASAGAGSANVAVAQPATGLGPGSVHYFRIHAASAGGAVDGAVRSFQTTGSAALLPGATTGTATLVSAASATLTGAVNPHGRATTYSFEYGKTDAYGSSTGGAGAGSGTGSVGASARLQFLEPGTTYHYRLTATSAVGTSFGDDRSFTTPELDRVGPRLRVSRRSLRMSAAGRLRVRVRCSAREPATCAGVLRLYRSRRSKSGKRVHVKVAARKFRIKPGKTSRIGLRLSRSARRLVLRQGSLGVLATARARDAAGNLGKASARFPIRPPRR